MWEWLLTFCKKVKARVYGTAKTKEMREIRRRLLKALREAQAGNAAGNATLTKAERALVERILMETGRGNRNNVTRTAAYLAFFQRRPEVHWALLAHLVSRNGGYNMTDLRGDLISRMMEPGEAERFFQFLERANYLIFGDAYPQLLLYEASVEQGKPLFHLLPQFRVSTFMRVVWERYWETRDSEILTIALVVNEQNFIEKRVVKNPEYAAVEKSVEFQVQGLLNLTQVVFPHAVAGEKTLSLAGRVVKTFLSLAERVDTGRHLYAILFGREEVLHGVLKWAAQTPHTGSRADYWPHLYTAQKPPGLVTPNRPYRPRLQGCELRAGTAKFFSPRLESTWPDVESPEPPGGSDWCVGAEAAEELFAAVVPSDSDVTATCCKALAFVEKAVAAETVIDGDGGKSS